MRALAIFTLAVMLAVLSGCSSRRAIQSARQADSSEGASTATAPQSESAARPASTGKGAETPQDARMKTASLTSAENSQTNVTVTERKLIRNAQMTIESVNPGESQRRVSMIAEGNGGFVVSSESRQTNAEGQLKPQMSVTVTIRVPAARFDSVVEEIRGTGSRVAQDKITTQDVTEEYIDLEARIRAKQALEAQFMEIMKQAKTVSDALEVQTQLSEVRSQIEQMEGRRRFLENQTSLSTITVTIQPPSQIVSSTGFFYSVKQAFSEGLDVAAMITLGLIQLVIALLPILIFIVLPAYLLLRYLIRRGRRIQARAASQPQPPPATAT
ncbi:MAG TPA: DUF4349 domain-containing protein [Pyrinomonadaceae bacterium]|nr:DUF4349 domain-containing protein [Pyrinomonadaceae bacterium]